MCPRQPNGRKMFWCVVAIKQLHEQRPLWDGGESSWTFALKAQVSLNDTNHLAADWHPEKPANRVSIQSEASLMQSGPGLAWMAEFRGLPLAFTALLSVRFSASRTFRSAVRSEISVSSDPTGNEHQNVWIKEWRRGTKWDWGLKWEERSEAEV